MLSRIQKTQIRKKLGWIQYAKFSRAIRVNAVAENMSLTSQEFESCCSKLVETPSQSALLKMTWFVDSLSVSSYDYQEFFLNKGNTSWRNRYGNFSVKSINWIIHWL